MIFHGKLYLVLFFIPLFIYADELFHDNDFSFNVRVLLDEKPLSESWQWHIQTEHGVKFSGFLNPEKSVLCKASQIVLGFDGKYIHINGKRLLRKNLIINPIEHYLGYNKNKYQGSFLIVCDDQNYYLVNQVPLEPYIFSVLRSESWPGWPVEVNKAFAIASRSYVVAKVLQARRLKKLYHIKDTNIHQTYNGYHTNPNLAKAVEQTKGLILTHDEKPIEAMFDSCCGGIIPAHIHGFDFIKAPYLARTQECTFCKTCKIYRWHYELALHELEHILNQGGVFIQNLQEITVTKKDEAGKVHSLLLKGEDKTMKLTGKQFYSLVKKVKSFCYSVAQKGKKILLVGRGYGHHLGICQWGARRMIDHGWSYRHILQFYYPDTTFMKLQSKETVT